MDKNKKYTFRELRSSINAYKTLISDDAKCTICGEWNPEEIEERQSWIMGRVHCGGKTIYYSFCPCCSWHLFADEEPPDEIALKLKKPKT